MLVERSSANAYEIQPPVIDQIQPTSQLELINRSIPTSNISIFSDVDLLNISQVLNWDGNGTSVNPFAIENYSFSNELGDQMIHIENTSLHVSIRNNEFFMFESQLQTINIKNSSNIRFENNIFRGVNQLDAIKLEYSRSISFTDNKFIGGNTSILGDNVIKSDIQDNSFNFTGLGVYLNNAIETIVRSNSFTHSDYAILLEESTSTIIDTNHFDEIQIEAIKVVDSLFMEYFIIDRKRGMPIKKNLF